MARKSQQPAPVADGDHVRGARDAAVTIIEYGDYDCPHTRAAQLVLDRLLAANPDVQIVYRHFPLRHIHANAEMLSRVAEAAHLQGHFWEMHDQLMAHRSQMDEKSLLADVREVGVDLATLQKSVNEPAVAARVERDVEQGRATGVNSTPTFFFDGVLHDGSYDKATLTAKLDEARERAR